MADYKAHCKFEQYAVEAQAQFRKDVLTRMAEGSKVQELDEDEDEDDLNFFADFRSKRLQGE